MKTYDKNLPKRIGLLPHHIAIFIEEMEDNYNRWEALMNYYKSEEYPEETIKKMANFFSTLKNSKLIEIEVIDEPCKDYICKNLCNKFIDEKCYAGKRAFDVNVDKKAMEKYNLSIGDIKTVDDLL